MKTLITCLILCAGVHYNLQAQDIFQSSVFIIERQIGQVKFDEQEKIVILQQLEDIKSEKISERKVQLEILEVIEKKGTKRFIVNDPKTDKVGLIYCFDVKKEGFRMFLKQRAKSLEYAKSFEIPKGFGIRTYSWKEVKKISGQKDPKTMPKEDAIKIMQEFKSKLKAITGEEIPEYREYDDQMYLKHVFYEVLAKHGYNIFMDKEPSLTTGVNQYFLDDDVKKLKDDIDLLIGGEGNVSEESIENDHK